MEKNSRSKIGPLRHILCILFFAAAVAAALGAVASSRAVNRPNSPAQIAALRKIAPWVTQHTAGGKQAEFLIVLADQADLRGAETLTTKSEKGRFVCDALWNKSQATQGPILQWVSERGIEHRSFYIVNAILVKGNRELAEALAARPDVARVEGNPQFVIRFLNQDLRLKHLSTQCARDGRTGNRLHACACCLGARLHRTEYCRWRAPIPVFAGRITRLNLTTAAGTGSRPITISIGMTPSTPAAAFAANSPSLAMTFFTAATPLPPRSAAMAAPTRSEWRRRQVDRLP